MSKEEIKNLTLALIGVVCLIVLVNFATYGHQTNKLYAEVDRLDKCVPVTNKYFYITRHYKICPMKK